MRYFKLLKDKKLFMAKDYSILIQSKENHIIQK